MTIQEAAHYLAQGRLRRLTISDLADIFSKYGNEHSSADCLKMAEVDGLVIACEGIRGLWFAPQ